MVVNWVIVGGGISGSNNGNFDGDDGENGGTKL